MIHPIPSGTRDVLPDETREVRAITDTLRSVFEHHGYGEVYTPALEYESVLARADMAEAQPAYRVFDESGAVLVLRSDMTVPIARVVATRYGSSEPPLRFCYFAHCYRGVRPQRGQPRELLQAGIELIGSPAPTGTAEALTVLCHALDAVGLKDYRIGLGDASLFPALMSSLQVREPVRAGLLEALVRRDFVGLEHRLAETGLSDEAANVLLEVPQRRGGPELLSDAPAPAVEPVTGSTAGAGAPLSSSGPPRRWGTSSSTAAASPESPASASLGSSPTKSRRTSASSSPARTGSRTWRLLISAGNREASPSPIR